MEEPSLWERAADQATTGYRLLWLRSFHRPVAIRVDLAPGVPPSVVVKVLDGEGGLDASRLEMSEQRVLTGREIRDLHGKLESTGFWELPPSRPTRVVDGEEVIMVCTDGAAWVLEGVATGRYHRVDWSCLAEGEPPRLLGEFFLGLSGIDFEEIY